MQCNTHCIQSNDDSGGGTRRTSGIFSFASLLLFYYILRLTRRRREAGTGLQIPLDLQTVPLNAKKNLDSALCPILPPRSTTSSSGGPSH